MKNITKNILLTIVILFILSLIFELTTIDIYIQDIFYNFESKQWVLDRDEALSKFIFYDGFKKIFITFSVSILIMLLFFRDKPIIAKYKKGLFIVLLSCIFVPAIIGFLKMITNVPCPKNIKHFGGDYPYVTVLSEYPSTFKQMNNIKCYPAGHASAGFALMSMFFLFSTKKNKHLALISSIVIGWAIGTYKMLIGDHFLSHTFITMIIAWLVILLIVHSVNQFEQKRR